MAISQILNFVEGTVGRKVEEMGGKDRRRGDGKGGEERGEMGKKRQGKEREEKRGKRRK